MDEEKHLLGNLAQMAALQLEINVPIMHVDRRGRVLMLYLYNRDEAVEWVIPETIWLPGDEPVMAGNGLLAAGTEPLASEREGESVGGEKSKKKRGKR